MAVKKRAEKASPKPSGSKRKSPIKYNIIRFLSAFYFIFLVALFIVTILKGDSNWLLLLLIYIPQIMYIVPAALLLIPSIAAKRKPDIVLNISSILIVMLFLMRLQLALPVKQVNGEKLTVLTYNIHAGSHGAENVAQFLKDSGADIIFLQESNSSSVLNTSDPVPIIKGEFSGYYFARGGDAAELFIISKYPLDNIEDIKLGRYREILTCTVRIGSKDLKLVNVHLSKGNEPNTIVLDKGKLIKSLMKMVTARKVQLNQLKKVIEESAEPVILAGDFNAPAPSVLHKQLGRQLSDSFSACGTGYGLTYSSSKPLWRIDYIYSDKKSIKPEKVKIHSVRLSDHRPVSAVFDIK